MPRDREYFSEWDGWAERWVEPNDTYVGDFHSTPQEGAQSVADWVISEIFDLTLANAGKGSSLPGYDIKYRNAYDMIQLSLAYHLKDNQLYECYANEIGEIEYYRVGDSAGGSSDIDEVYTIPSVAKVKPVDHVMIIGYDPPPRRVVGSEYNLFTFYNEYIQFDDSIDPDDIDYDTYPKYHAWADILGPEQCTYAKEGYIEYGDPSFDQERILVEADIIQPPYDNVVTYIYKMNIDWFEPGSTRVEFANRTPRYTVLDDMGNLLTRKWVENNKYVSEFCRGDQEPTDDEIRTHGVQLPDSDNRKFLGVREVYIYGYRVERIHLDYYVEGNERVKGPNTFLIDVNTTLAEPFRLSRGDDYIVVKDPESATGHYKIIFPCNIHPDYVEYFGGLAEGEVDVRISPASIYTDTETDVLVRKNILDIFNPEPTVEGVLKDGTTKADNSTQLNVSIFPMGEGQSGYVVEKLVVVYDWDNPCVALYDENNQVTLANMQNVSVTFYPIIMHDARAPIAYDGQLLDPASVLPDYDVNTVQNLETELYSRAFNELSQGDIKMTLPFIDADAALSISTNLRDLVNTSEGQQATIVCNPGSEPRLGADVGNGMVINSIDYSFQDSSQYLISIQAGPMWLGMSGWDTAVYQNKTERLQLEGVVIGTYDNNHKCQVDIQQIGVMECINGTRDIIEKGDRVTVSIYNNPVTM